MFLICMNMLFLLYNMYGYVMDYLILNKNPDFRTNYIVQTSTCYIS